MRFSVLVLVLCVCCVYSEVKNWNNMLGGNWHAPKNWIPEGIPGIQDDGLFIFLFRQNNYLMQFE